MPIEVQSSGSSQAPKTQITKPESARRARPSREKSAPPQPGTTASKTAERPTPQLSLTDAYLRIRAWYTSNVDNIKGGDEEYRAASQRLIQRMPDRASALEMRAVMAEVLTGLLEWGYGGSDTRFKNYEYAREAVEPFGGYSLSPDELAELKRTSPLWPFFSWGRREQPELNSRPTVPSSAVEGASTESAAGDAVSSDTVAKSVRPSQDNAGSHTEDAPQTPQTAVITPSPTTATSGAATTTNVPVGIALQSPDTAVNAAQAAAQVPPADTSAQAAPPGPPQPQPSPDVAPLPVFDVPPTPKVVSDQWVIEDTLGYEAYARALASLITHPDTQPPLTIGIEAPWGAGKTSVMKMIQHILDGEASVTEQNQAGKSNRLPESTISIETLLDALKHPEFDTHITPKSSELGERYGVPGRATVWFNAWKYQTSEQIWAGLAHCIINHVTVRMAPEQRELFWLKLNSRRVDPNAVRRKIYEAVLQDLLPRFLGWGIGLVLLLVLVFSLSLLGSTPYPELAKFFHWTPPLAVAIGGLDLWRKWTAAVNDKLRERAKGDLLKLVREPDYEGKMGFLYLVESDVREVLDLVATQDTPLVIFIDDLDRCVPHKVAEIVEAVSLFLAGDYPNCIFVLGMEPHVVAAALEVANSDLIKRMDELGLGDRSAPMGWRFMEKIVQLPLVLPPPTPSGLRNYMNGLAPDVEKPNSPQPVPVAPDEQKVLEFVATLSNVHTLSGVVAKTDELLSAQSRDDATAVAEASKRVFFRKFDEHDPLVRKFLDDAVRIFGANPRQIKRYTNLFRLCCNIRHCIWLDARSSNQSAQLPSDDEITKYVTFSVQWPQATSLLRRSAIETGGVACSLLKLLEISAVQLQTQQTEAAKKWAELLVHYNLIAGEDAARSSWIMDQTFRDFLARGSSLATAAGKGVF